MNKAKLSRNPFFLAVGLYTALVWMVVIWQALTTPVSALVCGSYDYLTPCNSIGKYFLERFEDFVLQGFELMFTLPLLLAFVLLFSIALRIKDHYHFGLNWRVIVFWLFLVLFGLMGMPFGFITGVFLTYSGNIDTGALILTYVVFFLSFFLLFKTGKGIVATDTPNSGSGISA